MKKIVVFLSVALLLIVLASIVFLSNATQIFNNNTTVVHNPYANVDWATSQKIMSTAHIHNDYPETKMNLYNAGIRYLPFSNYYPSNTRDYPLVGVPADLLGGPNAEHHGVTDKYLSGALHFNSLGSTYASGNPLGVEPVGLNDTWQNAFAGILSHLQYKDGGGIIINHPYWTRMRTKAGEFSDEVICGFLDYDSRVLGVEIYNHSAMRHTPPEGLAIDIWDNILKTGRRCFGFCDIDHANFNVEGYGLDSGRNMLLVPSATERECLRAYRNGEFYGAYHGNSIAFTKISATNQSVTVTTNETAAIRFVVNGETPMLLTGTSATYNVKPGDIYVRVEARTEKDTLYSQPIMYKTKEQVAAENQNK